MKASLLILMTSLISTFAHADFRSSFQELTKILSHPSVAVELEKTGDISTIRRISSGAHEGYQISTSGGCKLNALTVRGDVFVYPKECQ